MRVIRSLVAVLGGYLIFALSAVALFKLAGRAPHAPQPIWFMAVSVACGMVFAALAGAVGATVSLILSPREGSTWSQWSALLLMAPSAWLGGRLEASRSLRSVSMRG